MTDILIRNVPDEVVAAIDASAIRVGISRTEYLRRSLTREAHRTAEEVTVETLRQFATTFADLGDPEVMREAWS